MSDLIPSVHRFPTPEAEFCHRAAGYVYRS